MIHLNTFKAGVPRYDDLTTQILRKWIFANIAHPHATRETRNELAEITGLTSKQVYAWIYNTRRTKWFGAALEQYQKENGIAQGPDLKYLVTGVYMNSG